MLTSKDPNVFPLVPFCIFFLTKSYDRTMVEVRDSLYLPMHTLCMKLDHILCVKIGHQICSIILLNHGCSVTWKIGAKMEALKMHSLKNLIKL